MIPIYVGTDQRQGIAERVLEQSIRDHTDREFEIHWMRAEDPGWTGWNRRVPKDQYQPKHGGHGTWFSVYRYCVPELMRWKGKAIYLDSDMIVLGDIGELYDLNDGSVPYMASGQKRTEVGVLQCDFWYLKSWWPRIAEMRVSGWMARHYRKLLMEHKFLQPGVPAEWNCLDECPPNMKLLHFTRMPTQPWRPWPEAMQYQKHPCARARALWEEYRAKVEASGVL